MTDAADPRLLHKSVGCPLILDHVRVNTDAFRAMPARGAGLSLTRSALVESGDFRLRQGYGGQAVTALQKD